MALSGRGGWVGTVCTLLVRMSFVVLACESLLVRTVGSSYCEHARFCVEISYVPFINFHSFIH